MNVFRLLLPGLIIKESINEESANFGNYEYSETDAYYAMRFAGYVYTRHNNGTFPMTLPDGIQNITWVHKMWDNKYHLYSFTALDPQKQRIIVAFKGVSGVAEILFALTKTQLAKFNFTSNKVASQNKYNLTAQDIKIMYGYSQYWKFMRDPIIDNLFTLMNACKQCQLWFVGHSLGGAVASVAAYDITVSFNVDPSKVFIFTFGQPRVGNSDFAQSFNALFSNRSFRIVHKDDFIPHIIPCGHQGFGLQGDCSQSSLHPYHHDREIVYWDDLFCNYTKCDLNTEDPDCSNGEWIYDVLPTKDNAHNHYWNIIENGGFCNDLDNQNSSVADNNNIQYTEA